MSKNKLITIGWLGIRTAFLNVSREEAIRRYLQKNPEDADVADKLVHEFEFDDEFYTYEADALRD